MKYRKKTRRAKAKVGEQQNKVVLNYNTKYKYSQTHTDINK